MLPVVGGCADTHSRFDWAVTVCAHMATAFIVTADGDDATGVPIL